MLFVWGTLLVLCYVYVSSSCHVALIYRSSYVYAIVWFSTLWAKFRPRVYHGSDYICICGSKPKVAVLACLSRSISDSGKTSDPTETDSSSSNGLPVLPTQFEMACSSESVFEANIGSLGGLSPILFILTVFTPRSRFTFVAIRACIPVGLSIVSDPVHARGAVCAGDWRTVVNCARARCERPNDGAGAGGGRAGRRSAMTTARCPWRGGTRAGEGARTSPRISAGVRAPARPGGRAAAGGAAAASRAPHVRSCMACMRSAPFSLLVPGGWLRY